MTIITPTGITGINSITSTGNTLQFQNPSGADVSVSGQTANANAVWGNGASVVLQAEL